MQVASSPEVLHSWWKTFLCTTQQHYHSPLKDCFHQLGVLTKIVQHGEEEKVHPVFPDQSESSKANSLLNNFCLGEDFDLSKLWPEQKKPCKFCETGSEWDALGTLLSWKHHLAIWCKQHLAWEEWLSSCDPFHNAKILSPEANSEKETVSLPFTCDLAEFVFSMFFHVFARASVSGPSSQCIWTQALHSFPRLAAECA